MIDITRLRSLVEAGEIDTVLVAFPDMQGRLQGKRVHAPFFLDSVVEEGTEACNYLLAVDVDMSTVPGYAISSWERGYGDFLLTPDLTTLRLLPWQPGSAAVLADVVWLDGTPVAPAPRQVLTRQLARLRERGWSALVGTELEFLVFQDSYAEAWQRGYRALRPANRFNVDYSLLDTAGVEPVLRRIRTGMAGAGLTVESAKGECNLGQHEIAFRYAEALTTADNHSIYRHGAKEIAAQEGVSLTFMAKYDEREGNSCHVHLSLRDGAGSPVFAGDGPHGFSRVFEHFLAGQLACLRELSVLFAPTVNSYKRYVDGSFAPTALAWGLDNRTCALRVVGHGLSLRVENRVPGGDVNPYLAIAACIAAGLHGLQAELPLEEPCPGNAYTTDRERMPTSLREAAELFTASRVARDAFGDDVVDHYTHMAQVEVAASEAAVTDWDRIRGFERL